MKFPIDIVVPVSPVSKSRPRFNKDTGAVYTPKKTIKAEEAIGMMANIAMGSEKPLLDPVVVECLFYLKRTKASIKRGDEYPVTKCDVDNLSKTVLDGMNGIVYEDDAQVVVLLAKKAYSDNPRTEITVNLMV